MERATLPQRIPLVVTQREERVGARRARARLETQRGSPAWTSRRSR